MKSETQRAITQAEQECDRLSALWQAAIDRLEQLRLQGAKEWAQQVLPEPDRK